MDLSQLPKPKVKLVGTNGNAFALLGKIKEELRKAGWNQAQLNAFVEEAMDGDYNHLLQVCMKYAKVS